MKGRSGDEIEVWFEGKSYEALVTGVNDIIKYPDDTQHVLIHFRAGRWVPRKAQLIDDKWIIIEDDFGKETRNEQTGSITAN